MRQRSSVSASSEKYVKPGVKVLDLGTGSGILGIAALKLGADYVFGTDLDENAIVAVHENLACERDPGRRSSAVIQGNIIDDEAAQDAGWHTSCYDIAVANILAAGYHPDARDEVRVPLKDQARIFISFRYHRYEGAGGARGARG